MRDDLLIAGFAADRIGAADEIPGGRDVIEEDADDEGDAGDDRDADPAKRGRSPPTPEIFRATACVALMAVAAKPAGHKNIGQVSPTRKVSDFQRK